MSSPSPVTDGTHVWVMTGTGILKAFDFDGKELWTRDIQKDYGRFGLQLGLRLVAAAARRRALRAGAARHEDRRSVVPAAHRQGHRQDRLARRAADQRAIRSRPTRTPRPRCCATATTTEIVITGGDVVTGHDPATGKELWRANGLNPDQRRQLPHRRVAGRARRADHRADARAADAGAEGRRPRRRHQVARALVVRQRTRRADAGHRRHLPLRRQRPRHHVLPRREDRQGDLRPAAAAPGHLQRIAGARRRQDLRHQRGRRDERRQGRARRSRCWPRTTSTTTRSARRRYRTDRSSSGRGISSTPSASGQRALVQQEKRSGNR